MSGLRGRRVSETIRHHLTAMIAQKLEDPRLASLVVTEVRVPDDLGAAHVVVRSLTDERDERSRRAVLRALSQAAPRLRRALAPKLGLKRVPELRFSYDDGQDNVDRVNELLDEIAREPKAPDGDPED